MKHSGVVLSREVWDRLKDDPFPEHLGIEILDLKPGYCRVGLHVADHMTNILRITHGGVVFTLADVALGLAANAEGVPAVAMNVNIFFLKTSSPGDYLEALAEPENMTRKTGLYRVEVRNSRGEMVAVANSLIYRKG